MKTAAKLDDGRSVLLISVPTRRKYSEIRLHPSVRRIKWWLVLCVLVWLLAQLVQRAYATQEASADWSSGRKKGKWIFFPRTVTKYLRVKSSVVETVTSSCVVVPQSLPRCRNARQTRIQPTATLRMERTESATSMERMVLADSAEFLFSSEASIDEERLFNEENGYKPLSWAEYFGLETVTVTETSVYSVTAKYHDPNTVIVFDVEGCRPTDLPFNLPLCSSSGNSPNIDANSSATTRSVNTITKVVHYVP